MLLMKLLMMKVMKEVAVGEIVQFVVELWKGRGGEGRNYISLQFVGIFRKG